MGLIITCCGVVGFMNVDGSDNASLRLFRSVEMVLNKTLLFVVRRLGR